VNLRQLGIDWLLSSILGRDVAEKKFFDENEQPGTVLIVFDVEDEMHSKYREKSFYKIAGQCWNTFVVDKNVVFLWKTINIYINVKEG
jgi:hypothetical protein